MTPPEGGSRLYLLIASIVSCAFFLEAFDGTAIVQALPHIAVSFGVGTIDLSLGVTAYMLAIAVLTPASAWLAERLGARNVFCAAVALFTIASALCGFSDTFWQFILARILQGSGGALMATVGRIAVLRTTAKADLVRAMNFIVTPGLLGMVLGPAVGGLIAEYASWRWIFFLTIPVGVLGMALAWRFMPNHRSGPARAFDGAGFFLNGGALSGIIYGMDRLAGGDWLWGAGLTLLGSAIGFRALQRAKSHPHPLVDLGALRVKTFAAINIGGQWLRLGVAGPSFVVPLMLQLGLGLNAVLAGVLILGHSAGDIAMKAVTRRVVRRFGFRANLIWTCVLFAACVAACALFTVETPLWAMFALLFVAGAIRSQQFTCHNAMQFADIAPEGMSAASTLSQALMFVSRSIGIALCAILLKAAAALNGDPAGSVTLLDFRIVLVILAVVTLGSLPWYVRLRRDAAAEVSGHRQDR